MKIDLRHNKIVDSLITEGFERSVRQVLLPLLLKKHGEGLLGIQMYEDYISDKLLLDGEWYYPLTLVTDGGIKTEWIKWRLDKKRFPGLVPYAYVGEDDIDFSLVGNAPAAFVNKISGRAVYAEEGLVKVVFAAASHDPAFLSGRCSQTFVDELARQIGPAIEKFLSVSGLSDSGISLSLTFAPETYMEHTSESVTYRRLLISDGSAAPRDFWIKWTRLDGLGAFTVASHPTHSEILFELGEDVPRKVCEKEYRFLIGKGRDAYHRAMGRKNITEWREVIKRAVRRGELMTTKDMNEISEETRALDAMLAEVLGVSVSDKTEAPEVEVPIENGEDEFSLAMKFVRETALGIESAPAAEEKTESTELFDSLFSVAEESVERGGSDEDELLEITRMAREALAEMPAESEEITANEEIPDAEELAEESEEEILPEEENTLEKALLLFTESEEGENIVEVSAVEEMEPEMEPESDEIPEDEYEDEYSEEMDEDELADVRALEPDEEEAEAEEPVVIEESAPTLPDSDELEARIRGEVEAKLRLEYEREARLRAEAEVERLRAEQKRLALELEKMREMQRLFEEERARLESERAAEEERLRQTIEQQMRAETKERERLAEAARLEVLEMRRIEEERAAEERARLEAEAENARAAEAARLEEERAREAERIRREAEERAKPQSEILSAPDPSSYTYVSKLVKLRFRRSVDPNITTRIYEIIKATVEYYGKEKVYLRIKASIPDNETVNLEFVEIPLEEMELLSNIIKVLGNSGLGIAKAIVE